MIGINLEEYYNGRISTTEVTELLGIKNYELSRYFEKRGLYTYNVWLKKLNFKNKELNAMLRNKYKGIKERCNGINDKYGHYTGLQYLNVIQWVNFCNQNKDILEIMWEEYVNHGKNLKYAISIDRVDKNKGYVLGNLEFVPHGYNSWKDHVRPIKVEYSNETYYFLSCQEASRFFNIRNQSIGECLRKEEHRDKRFNVDLSKVETILIHSKCKTLREYYDKYIK